MDRVDPESFPAKEPLLSHKTYLEQTRLKQSWRLNVLAEPGARQGRVGERRDGDFSGLEILAMAVAVFAAGSVLRDYQTAETVPTPAVKALSVFSKAAVRA